MNIPKIALLATVCALSVSVCGWAAPPCDGFSYIYCQPFDQTGNAYSSQNDTASLGNFATTYDNFTLAVSTNMNAAQWVGEYFNPPNPGPITGWTVALYGDNGGQPGSLLFSQHTAGTDNETFLGTFGGFPTYLYSTSNLGWFVNAGTQYWVAVIPDLGFPPQWGWSSGTGGDGISYQDFFGTRSQLAADMAMALGGTCCCCGTPEPGTLLMVGTGAVGAGIYYADMLGLPTLAFFRRWRRKLD
jgi:hypothetical protein